MHKKTHTNCLLLADGDSALKRLAIVINVIPDYRKVFYQELLKITNLDITIYCQSTLKGLNLQLCHREFKSNVRLVAVCALDKERLAWQHLPAKKMLAKFDMFLFLGNPRLISTVFWATIFRILGKKVAIWGQAHSAGANRLSESMRLMWWRMFTNIFVYTDNEVAYLRSRGFKTSNIIGMNNGLDQNNIDRVQAEWSADRLNAWRNERGLAGKKLILSCARLDEKNQFCLVLDAMEVLLHSHPEVVWCVIGDGDERDRLQASAKEKSLENSIRWVGAVHVEEQLAPWFMSSEFMLHPGAIGLSILHSFGYGLPVITHNNAANHFPEFAAMEDKRTGYLYQEGSFESLVDILRTAMLNSESLIKMGEEAVNRARSQYNTDVMRHRFSAFISAM